MVNCAGIGWAARTIGRDGEYSSAHDLDVYRKVIEINLIGTFNVLPAGGHRQMSLNTPDEDGSRGAIVNTASVAAEDGQIGQVAYSSSKGGVVGLTLPLARDLAADRRPGQLPSLPGLIDTPIYGDRRGLRGVQGPPRRQACSSRSAWAARTSSPPLAVELLANSYMNAESIRIDAGIRMPPK